MRNNWDILGVSNGAQDENFSFRMQFTLCSSVQVNDEPINPQITSLSSIPFTYMLSAFVFVPFVSSPSQLARKILLCDAASVLVQTKVGDYACNNETSELHDNDSLGGLVIMQETAKCGNNFCFALT